MAGYAPRSRRERVTADVRRAVSIIRERRLTFMAGALAYAAFLSLVPVLVVVLTAATLIRGDQWVAELMALVESQIGPRVASVVGQALGSSGGMLSASIVGVVVLLWGAIRVFRGLDIAVNTVYGSGTGSFVSTLHDGLLTLVALIFAVVALVSVEALIRTFVESTVVMRAAPIFLWLALTITLLPIYTVLPDVHISLQEALPGAAFTGLAWLLLSDVFGLYVAATDDSSSLFGGIVLLLTLLYFAMLVLLVGAVVNAVLAGRGDVPGERSPGALN